MRCAAVATVFGALVLAGSAAAIIWPTGHPLRLLVVGDSISAGWKASAPSKAFPALLAARLRAHGKVTLTVKAVPGVTASYWSERALPAADLVVIELGTNDYGGDVTTPISQFATAYRTDVKRARAASPKATLVCLALWRSLGSKLTRSYNATIQKACVGGTYVQIDELFDKPGMRSVSDHFHPGNLGHAQIARMVEQALGV